MIAGAPRARWRARAASCGASLACAALVSLQSPPSGARDQPLARVEGPPDSGVTLHGSEAALKELAAGDAAWLEAARERAFDAWRRAIEAGAPTDVVVAPPPGPAVAGGPPPDADGTLTRRAEDVSTSVRRRVHAASAADRAAWRERFEPLAAATLDGAAGDEASLRALEHAFPLTRAAALAALALADGALERAETDAAHTWLRRARVHAAEGDVELVKALERRAEAASQREEDDAIPGDVAGIELVRVVDLGSERSARARRVEAAIPGLVLARDGTTWLHAAGRLAAFDGEGRALAAIDVGATLSAAKVDARTSFSEPGALWDDAFALEDGFLTLVAGRAREDAGNALAGFDVRAVPRLAWVWSERGLARARASGTVGTRALVGADALLEFQPGPCRAGNLLVVHVRAWPHADGASPDLDEAAVEAWCAGLDPRDGSVRWTRRLASGATNRGLGRGRMAPPEPTSLPALPLATDGQRVAVDTGLGAIALLDAVDGRVVAIVRTARSAAEAAARPRAVGGIVRGDGPTPAWWFAPAEAGGALLRLRDDPDADGRGLWTALPLPLEGPRVPVFASGEVWTALAGERRADLRIQDLGSGREVRSVPFPLALPERGAAAAARLGSGWIVAGQGRVWRLDPARELALQDELEIGSGSAWPVVAIAVRGGLARIASGEHLAFVRAR